MIVRSIGILLLNHIGYTSSHQSLSSRSLADSPLQPHRIDFSYESHVSSDEIARSIRDQVLRRISLERKGELASKRYIGEDSLHIDSATKIDNQDDDVKTVAFEIDVSSSLVGDEGINAIMDVIESEDNESESAKENDVIDFTSNNPIILRSIDIRARMNHLTPKGATQTLNRLTVWGEREANKYWSKTVANQTAKVDVTEEVSTWKETNETHLEVHTINDENNSTNKIESSADTPLNRDETKDNVVPKFSSPPSSENVNVYLESIDFGFNNLGIHGKNFDTDAEASIAFSQQRTFLKALEKVIENESGLACPRILRMDRCCFGPPLCRSIGRGIIDNAISSSAKTKDGLHSLANISRSRRLKALHLSGNTGIGDNGATALAAALKNAPRIPFMTGTSIKSNYDNVIDNEKTESSTIPLPVLNTLDLSVCGIGDTGTVALAIALAYNPGCVKKLDLSGNQISDEGAMAIGRALQASMLERKETKLVFSADWDDPAHIEALSTDTIDLSNNKNIGDDGASELAVAFENGAVRCLSLCSCSLGRNGASAMGKALGNLALNYSPSTTHNSDTFTVELDLSGNTLGSNEPKKSGMKYSASAFTSKASATTTSYMNFIGKQIKSVSGIVGVSAQNVESDTDEEDDLINMEEPGPKQSGVTCSVTSFCDAMIESIKGDNKVGRSDNILRIKLGLRMCNLGDEGVKALAAAIISMRDKCGVNLVVDARMNLGIVDTSLKALSCDDETSDITLRDLAQDYFDKLEAAENNLDLTDENSDDLQWDDGVNDFTSDTGIIDGLHEPDESDGYAYDPSIYDV